MQCLYTYIVVTMHEVAIKATPQRNPLQHVQKASLQM